MSPLQPRQRRFVVPLVFGAIALVLGMAAVRAGSAPEPDQKAAAVKPLTTPVLSVRRTATYLVAPIADARMRERLDQVVAESPDDTCLTVSLGGRVIFEHNPDMPVVPASAEKLVTGTAALLVLGEDTRLRTKVVAAAPPDGGTVNGDLFLVGGGDPVLATEDYVTYFRNQPQIWSSLEKLADNVAAAGITRVTGRLLGDESRYDSDRYPDSWPQRYADQSQIGPLSALAVNDGFSDWPSQQAREGAVENTPSADPVTLAADTFLALLQARGVTVDGGTGVGTAPEGAPSVAGLDSPPMKEIVRQMLTESDNQTAEMLVKEMGLATSGTPTTAAGVQAVTAAMEEAGLARPGTAALDGSGLDEGNTASCRLLMGVLDREGPNGLIAGSLAIAGKTGTLADRFQDSPAKERLRAKTGTLNTVTALAGFATAIPGPTLTFAYVANGEYINEGLLAIQETLGGDLVTYPEGPPLASVSPQP